MLAGLGTCAALARCLVKTRWGLPGHSILLVILPLAVGVAMSRRQGAGTVMGISGLATGLILTGFGVGGMGVGALTSLAVAGPILDFWLRKAKNGVGIYASCIASGFMANAVAFVVRALSKMLGLQPGHHPRAMMKIWAPRAIVSYTVCGLLAGLISAWVCFRLLDRNARE